MIKLKTLNVKKTLLWLQSGGDKKKKNKTNLRLWSRELKKPMTLKS